ncbi:MAG TPA: thiamine pyrophosphate-dependent dehydrogenase E1 component subunit alpha [Blastocatellia bacterium]|nr:thiamine pyrophosphate-dependent dehydrogenase E1 component subunit alpha [Blastocatellia bacterium]
MIRYPAYDPPEYVDWKAERAVAAAYLRTTQADKRRRAVISRLTARQLCELYEGMVRNRLHDIALKRWVKQGVISKSWLGTGEEATTIGPVHALERNTAGDGLKTDFVSPMIRNAGACHEMGMPVADMLRGYLGTDDSPTRGRDLHIGDFSRGVLAPISHVGETIPVAAGVALTFKRRREPRVVLAWIGDGSTKAGPFHEGFNFAAVQRLPLIVIIQNNQVALGTKLNQYQRGSFAQMIDGYGVEGWQFDGNNVLDAYAAVKLAVDRARSITEDRGPFLLVAETFRMGGHATHDEREARETFPAELFAQWGKRDPIGLFEHYLVGGLVDLETGKRLKRPGAFRKKNAGVLERIEQRVIAEIDQAAEEALLSARTRQPQPESASENVYSRTYEDRLAAR